jgi:hypothetical protein
MIPHYTRINVQTWKSAGIIISECLTNRVGLNELIFSGKNGSLMGNYRKSI